MFRFFCCFAGTAGSRYLLTSRLIPPVHPGTTPDARDSANREVLSINTEAIFSTLLCAAYRLKALSICQNNRPGHCPTMQSFWWKNHLLRAYYLGFVWSGWIVLIKKEILIVTGIVWPVSYSKWKAPLDQGQKLVPSGFTLGMRTPDFFEPVYNRPLPSTETLFPIFEGRGRYTGVQIRAMV